jgi:thiosulfate/3-mercaptopyruvate sulfurtransferase
MSTEALASHLDGSWVIVDCRYDLKNGAWGAEQYRAAHIPGAVYASLSHDLAGPATGTNGRHPIPAPAAMEATFGRLGITAARQAVIYDQDVGMFASRLWWMLRYMGHDLAAVLDGGLATWTREGRPTRAGEETRAAERFAGQPRPEMRADVIEVARRLDDPSMLLVDARAPERFAGTTEPLDRLAGHIPGAVNYFYKSNVTAEGTMLPPETLRQQFAGVLGGRAPDQAVMYCGSGVSACHNTLAMERAGLRGSRLYPGSWSEWSSDPGRPVETGPPKAQGR